MDSFFTLPITIISQYRKAVRKNYGDAGQPRWDPLIFWVAPALFAVYLAAFRNLNLPSEAVQNLLTVHGIFLSVLVASYVPFLDYVADRKIARSKSLDTEAEMEDAIWTVKGMLFALNSFAVMVSLAVVILLCFVTKAQAIESEIFTTILNGSIEIRKSVFIIPFKVLLFYLMTLNGLNIFRILQVMNSIVAPKVFK